MKHDALSFLRGTYYRWVQLWPEVCRDCIDAPIVLSVGDLHIDSFGTWRDAEGRLCWGVDDFDKSWPLPYTNDLVRLAASVKIARKLGFVGSRQKQRVRLFSMHMKEPCKKKDVRWCSLKRRHICRNAVSQL